MTVLDTPGIPKKIASQLLIDMDQYVIGKYADKFRWHLGASLIGHNCPRYLWYVVRWCGTETPNGRKQRLFQRGHREEAWFVEMLRGVGCKVWTHDESQPKKEDGTYPQFRMSAVNGHFGGSCDGIVLLPERYGIEEPLLTEYKTNGTGAGFKKLTEDGIAIAKYQHFGQMSTYGKHFQLNYGAYFNVNKNDDDLHIEIVKLDTALAIQLEDKARKVIYDIVPPPRISNNPTFFECKWCPMHSVCHEGAVPLRNCRSCEFASPSDDPKHPGEWFCVHHKDWIPRDFAPVGCGNYTAIKTA